MAAVEDLMAAGLPATLAKIIGLEIPNTALTATGSTQTGALVLTSTFSIFGTVSSSTGAILATGKNQFVYNGGSNALSVYPPVGYQINGTTINTAISVPANKGAFFMPSRGLEIAALVSA